MRALLSSLSLLCSGLLLAACGGGGGGGDDAGPVQGQMTLKPVSSSTWKGNGQTAFVQVQANDLMVGDTFAPSYPGNDVPMRSIFKFDRSQLPAGAKVTGATVRFRVTGGNGSPSNLGILMVDHIDWKLNENATSAHLTGQDTGIADEDLIMPTFQIIGQPSLRYAHVVEQVLQDELAGRDATSFRVRFQTPYSNTLVEDYLVLGGYHAPSAKTWDAELLITYEIDS